MVNSGADKDRKRSHIYPWRSAVKLEVEGELKEFNELFCFIKSTEVRASDENVATRIKNLPNFLLFAKYIKSYEKENMKKAFKKVLITEDWDTSMNLLYKKNRMWVFSAKAVTDIIESMNKKEA